MRTLLIASAVVLLAFAPAPLPRREKGKDHETQLIGTWRIRTIRWQGRDSYTAAAFGDRLVVTTSDRVVISRGRITFQADGGAPSTDRACTFQLSGGGEVRQMDFGEGIGRPVLGLYRLEGRVLRLAIGYAGGKRPKQLSGDGGEIAFILDRR